MISIGAALYEAREKKEQSIKDAEKETKIRAKYLEALEQNKFDLIPGDAYVKIFIREYANFLDIDPNPLIKEYDEKHVEASLNDRLMPMGIDRPKRKHPVLIAFISIVVMLIAGGLVLWQMGWLPAMSEKALIENNTKPEKTQSDKPSKDSSGQEKVEKEDQAEESPSGLPNASSGEQELKVRITVTGQKGTSVKTVVDEEELFDGHLNKGQVKEWPGKKKIVLSIVDPSVVRLEKNGVEVEGVSDKEEPLVITLTPER